MTVVGLNEVDVQCLKTNMPYLNLKMSKVKEDGPSSSFQQQHFTLILFYIFESCSVNILRNVIRMYVYRVFKEL